MVHQFKKAPKKEEACCLPGEGLTDEEFASFCRLEYPDETVLYIDGAGQQWTEKQWEKRFGYNPVPVWDRMCKQKIAVLGWNSEKDQAVGSLGKFPTQGDSR